MSWKKELKDTINTLEELKSYINLTPQEEDILGRVIDKHPMRITKYYLSLIDKNDRNDPLRKLVVPLEEELITSGSYDTSGEEENTRTIGLQHKYSQTALLLATDQCSAYCRFCFRKRLVGVTNSEILRHCDAAMDYIRRHREINNVLISGGDPFILPIEVIEKFLRALSSISHVDFIRFGTRVPVVFPSRILKGNNLLKNLKKYSREEKRIYVITHFNHPGEITKESIEAVNRLIDSNIIINNQTVLMRGVNDNDSVLSDLLNNLVKIGVNPYYVFQCRPVMRVQHHFQVPLYNGYQIVEKAKKRLNGISKRFKYIMSHWSGKIEIIGIMDDEIYFKYHQARLPEDIGRFFKRRLNREAGWIDELEEVEAPQSESIFCNNY